MRLRAVVSLAGGLWAGAWFGSDARASESYNAAKWTIPVTTTVRESPPQIAFSWPTNAGATRYDVWRKAPEDLRWPSTAYTSITVNAAACTGFVDSAVTTGTNYEYRIASAYDRQVYVVAGMKAPMVDARGTLILLVDDSMSGPLSNELARLQQDLIGDGWEVLRHDVSRDDSVTNVRAVIYNEYAADSNNVKFAFLFGHIPVPYTGLMNPDGHSEHYGAWPTDLYYGDMDGTWTDTTLNWTNAADCRNWNAPGDGKFDMNLIPGDRIEVGIGRVDLSQMPDMALSETELLRRYLDKDHHWRHGATPVRYKGLVDDGFFPYSYAVSGFRSFYALFGAANVEAEDYMGTMATNSYVWSYGCGPGSYNSATGIGPTRQFGITAVQTVFTMLFGSYFGDWDSTNCLLRAPLGSPDYGLACVWSGRPVWSFHQMGMGATLGYSAFMTQNDQAGLLYYRYYTSVSTHVSLMGDPTLRLHPVIPPSELVASSDGKDVALTWVASPDSDIVGYHVYRSPYPEGRFVRLTDVWTADTNYIDAGAVPGTNTYMVRAVKLQTVGSGSYYNPSQGIFFLSTGIPDVEAPTAPTDVAMTARTDQSVSLAWAAAADNVGVTQYLIYTNGALAGSSVSTQFLHAGLAAGAAYVYTIKARDVVGNLSPASSPGLDVSTLPLDTQAPTAPGVPVALSNALGSISLAWAPSVDNMGVTGYRVYESGNLVAEVAGTNFTHTGLSLGSTYHYVVRAVDARTNVSAASYPELQASTLNWCMTNGLALWLKADVGVVVDPTAPTYVARWLDQSGNGNDAIPSVATGVDTNGIPWTAWYVRPGYVASSLNGKPGVHFSDYGVNGQNAWPCFVTNGSGLDMLRNVSGTTVFCVYKNANTNEWQLPVVVASGLPDSNVGAEMYRMALSSRPLEGNLTVDSRRDRDGALTRAGGNGFVSDQFLIHCGVGDFAGEGSLKCYKNGGQIGSTVYLSQIRNSDDTPSVSICIGGAWAGACIKGDIAEIMIYPEALSDVQRRTVEGYLGAKYGLDGTWDNLAPSLAVRWPGYSARTIVDSVTLEGTALDSAGIQSVTVNGLSAATTNGFADWRCIVTGLAPGTNILTVVATDGKSNAATNRVVVVYDAAGEPSGLIGYWSLDETSGAVAHDGSGSGHDGTVYGAPARTAAVIGDGLRFNGVATNDYVRLPNSPAMDSVQEGNYTLAAWVKPLSVPPGTGGDNNAGYGVIMKEGMHIGLKYAGTGQFSIGHYLASNVWRSANTMTVTTGRFYHVAGTVDKTNGTMRLYLDGMLQSTNSWTGNTPAREFGTATWKIGLAWPNMPTWACLAHAVIDEVRIYDRVLTQPEVHAIMEANPPPIVTVAYPANLSYTTNVTVSVGGKAYDADGVAGVTVNGIAAASTNNYTNWNRGVAGLAAGTNVLTVVATDTAANAETNRVLVLYATGAFDGNGDGVPDSWQIANFGFGFRTNAAAGREADPDGDRMPNWSEQIAGTDPTNGLSRLALEGIAGQGAGAGVTVRWQSVTGKRYAGERSTNLPATASFHGMFTNLPGQPGWTEYVDTNAPGAGPFFYRIGVE